MRFRAKFIVGGARRGGIGATRSGGKFDCRVQGYNSIFFCVKTRFRTRSGRIAGRQRATAKPNLAHDGRGERRRVRRRGHASTREERRAPAGIEPHRPSCAWRGSEDSRLRALEPGGGGCLSGGGGRRDWMAESVRAIADLVFIQRGAGPLWGMARLPGLAGRGWKAGSGSESQWCYCFRRKY